MASPTVSARNQTNSGNATNHPAALATHTTGELLVEAFAFDGAPTITINEGTSSANWTLETPDSHSTGTPTVCIVWKVAESASEVLNLTTGVSEASANMGWAIDAGASPSLEFAYGESSGANPDPPALTPAAGSQDYLWLTGFGRDNQATASAGPDGWDQFRTEPGVSSGGASMAVAELTSTGTTADPGPFTIGVETTVTFTISVYNAAGGGAQDLLPSLVTNTVTIHAPTVTGGAIVVAPPLVTNDQTFYSPAITGGEQAKKALSFPSNDEANSDVKLVWANSTSDMPPRTAHLTVHWSKYRQQAGFYAHWWTMPNLSSNYADITGDYFSGYHPYPCDGLVDPNGTPTNPTGGAGTEHFYEIAGLPNTDVIGDAADESLEAIKGVWIAGAHYTEESGANTLHRHYPDLFGNPDFFITVSQPTADITGDPKITADRALMFGANTWTVTGSTNAETASGEVRGIRIFDITSTGSFSVADMQAEARAAWESTNTPATSEGVTAVWYINDNPTHTDVSDKSGEGHDPVWGNAIRPTTVDIQSVGASLVANGQIFYAPTVDGEAGGQVLSPGLLTNVQTIYSPTVSPGAVILALSLLTNTTTLYAPLVSAGGSVVEPPLLENAQTLYAPSINVGPVTVSPSVLANDQTFYVPTVSQVGGSQSLTPLLLSNNQAVYEPSILNAATLSTPTATSTSATTGSGTVITDKDSGTLYYLANTSSTATVLAVKAGFSQPVISAGVQGVNVDGLTTGLTYYIHFVHTDADEVDSARVTSNSFEPTEVVSTARAAQMGLGLIIGL